MKIAVGADGLERESGSLRAVHLSRHKWPGGQISEQTHEARGALPRLHFRNKPGPETTPHGLHVAGAADGVWAPGKGNLNSHGARPVHLIVTMMKWIRTSRLSIKNSLHGHSRLGALYRAPTASAVTEFLQFIRALTNTPKKPAAAVNYEAVSPEP